MMQNVLLQPEPVMGLQLQNSPQCSLKVTSYMTASSQNSTLLDACAPYAFAPCVRI